VAAQAQAFDIPYLGFTALLVLPMLLLGRITRAGGALLLVSYAVYLYLTWAISVDRVVLPAAWTGLF
jgi:Ca2+/Na+ antiporter